LSALLKWDVVIAIEETQENRLFPESVTATAASPVARHAVPRAVILQCVA